MNPLFPTITTLAVATIYVLWHKYHAAIMQRQRALRSRVTYMLWCASQLDG